MKKSRGEKIQGPTEFAAFCELHPLGGGGRGEEDASAFSVAFFGRWCCSLLLLRVGVRYFFLESLAIYF